MIFDRTKNQGWLENIFCMHVAVDFGNSATAKCFLGLYTTMPGDDGTGAVEVSGNGYSRIYIAGAEGSVGGNAKVMNTNYKSFALGEQAKTAHYRRIGNTDEMSFHEAVNPADEDAPTGGDWGHIVGFGLFTAATGGNAYAWGRVNNYELLAEEPEDWEENYTSYYTRSGSAGSYIYTKVPAGDAAPDFETDTYYGRWITVATHNKLIFREGHFEVFTTEDDD